MTRANAERTLAEAGFTVQHSADDCVEATRDQQTVKLTQDQPGQAWRVRLEGPNTSMRGSTHDALRLSEMLALSDEAWEPERRETKTRELLRDYEAEE